jgi:hypothetical protein
MGSDHLVDRTQLFVAFDFFGKVRIVFETLTGVAVRRAVVIGMSARLADCRDGE